MLAMVDRERRQREKFGRNCTFHARAHLQQEACNLSKLYEHKKSYKIDDFGYIIIRSDILNGVS